MHCWAQRISVRQTGRIWTSVLNQNSFIKNVETNSLNEFVSKTERRIFPDWSFDRIRTIVRIMPYFGPRHKFILYELKFVFFSRADFWRKILFSTIFVITARFLWIFITFSLVWYPLCIQVFIHVHTRAHRTTINWYSQHYYGWKSLHLNFFFNPKWTTRRKKEISAMLSRSSNLPFIVCHKA